MFYLKPDYTIYNDTFAGTDGAPPDYDKWNTMQSWNRNDPFILDDSLYFDSDTNDSWLGSSYHLQGDFDIQIDWAAEAIPTDRQWRVAFGVWQEDMTGDEDWDGLFVTRMRDTTRLSACTDNMGYTLAITTGGSTTYSGVCDNTDTSGKLRLVRSGSTAAAYYDNGGGWQLINSRACSAEPGRIWIGGAGWGTTGTQPNISFTNFKINSVDSVLTDKVYFSGTQPEKFGTAFNGDNNSAPNPTVWTVTSGGAAESYINNDKLRMTVTAAGDSIYAYYDAYFEEDFDVVMDWEESGANANWWTGGLIAYESDGSSWSDDHLVISRLYTSFDQYRSDTKIGGVQNVGTPTSTSDTSGKFRVSRYGGAVRVYYWNNSSNNWDQTADEHTLTTTSGIKVVIRLVTGSTGTSHTFDYDNFHVVYDQSGADGWVNNYGPANDTMRYVDHNRLLSQPVQGTSSWLYHPYWLTGDVDVRVSARSAWAENSTDTDYGWILQLWDPNSSEYFEVGRWRLSSSHVIRTRYDIGAGVVEDTVAMPSSIRLRLNRTGSTWIMYYYDFTNRTWINMTQVTGGTQDLTLWLGTYASPISSQTAGEFHYFILDGTNGSSYTYS